MDERRARLEQWLADTLGERDFVLTPASEDASFRRYFRVQRQSGSRIVMDAPPEREDCRPWLAIAGRLRAAGLHAPEIEHSDAQAGFVLMEDLGDTTYLSALSAEGRPDGLYDAAIAGPGAHAAASGRRRSARLRRGPAAPRTRAVSRLVSAAPAWS
jgi:aminoglycoside/choline kinase family phosphotransferase